MRPPRIISTGSIDGQRHNWAHRVAFRARRSHGSREQPGAQPCCSVVPSRSSRRHARNRLDAAASRLDTSASCASRAFAARTTVGLVHPKTLPARAALCGNRGADRQSTSCGCHTRYSAAQGHGGGVAVVVAAASRFELERPCPPPSLTADRLAQTGAESECHRREGAFARSPSVWDRVLMDPECANRTRLALHARAKSFRRGL